VASYISHTSSHHRSRLAPCPPPRLDGLANGREPAASPPPSAPLPLVLATLAPPPHRQIGGAPLAAGLLFCSRKGGPGAEAAFVRLKSPSYGASGRLPPFHYASSPVPTIEACSNSQLDECCTEEEGIHHTKGQEGDHLSFEIKFNCTLSSRTAKAAFPCQCRPPVHCPCHGG
jgi:hypothetical protein